MATSAAVLEFIFSINVFEKIEIQYCCFGCGLDIAVNSNGSQTRGESLQDFLKTVFD